MYNFLKNTQLLYKQKYATLIVLGYKTLITTLQFMT